MAAVFYEGRDFLWQQLPCCHANEGESIAEVIRDCLDYGKNPEKTEDGKYISSYECDPATVAAEFLLAKASYKVTTGWEQKKGSIRSVNPSIPERLRQKKQIG